MQSKERSEKSYLDFCGESEYSYEIARNKNKPQKNRKKKKKYSHKGMTLGEFLGDKTVAMAHATAVANNLMKEKNNV